MTDSMEDIKRKIAALLAKANNTAATEAEAEAFNNKAHELMAKYNIARAELEKEQEAERCHFTLIVQFRPWSQYVLQGLVKLYYCSYFSRKLDAKGRQHEITIVGEKQNAAVCHAIAILVLRSIQTAARAAGDGRSFMTGAGIEVHRRCNEMFVAAHSTLQGASAPAQLEHNRSARALVVMAVGEAQGNQDYIRDKLGINLVTRKASGPKVSDLSSFQRGVSHGSTVQLRRNLLS